MSAAPNLPPYYRPEEVRRRPKQRRARWKKIVAWVAGIFVLLIVASVITVYVLLHNQRFHAYVLRTAEQKATAMLGTHVQAGGFALHFHGISPTLDLYNVVIDGAAPYRTPPVLAVNHIRLGVRVVSLFSRTLYMDDVAVDHPVVRVFFDKRGVNNLPQTKSSQSGSKSNIFDLGVRHALLDNGELYYNNQKSLMNADLHNLTFRSAFEPAAKKYSGSVSYSDGHLKLGSYQPIPHSLNAYFEATPQEFTLRSARLSSGNSHFALNASVTNYAQPKLNATYNAALDGTQFRRILKNSSLPMGTITAEGSLQYQTKPNTPMIALITLNGDLGSRALLIATPSLRTRIQDVGAHYSVVNGILTISQMRAHLLGGELGGELTVRDLAGKSSSHLSATLRGISVAECKSLVKSQSLEKVAANGRVNANAEARWGPTINTLIAKMNANLNAAIVPRNGAAIPLAGVVHATYTNANKAIAFSNSSIRSPASSLQLNGTVSNRSALQIRMQSSDLHELDAVAQEFRSPSSQPLGLHGSATFNAMMRGSMAAPRLNGHLNAVNLQVHGTAWRLLRSDIQASPSAAALTNGELDAAKRGRIIFSVSAGLKQWAFSKSSPVKLNVQADNLDAGDLAKAGGVQTPINGTLSANAAVDGTELNPIGQGNLRLRNARVSSETVNLLQINFNGTGRVVNATLAARIPAGAADGKLTYFPRTQIYDLALNAPNIQLGQLGAVRQRGMNLSGALTLVANGHGTTNNPQIRASMRIPKLTIDNQAISGIALDASLSNHVGNYNLSSQMMSTYIRSQGTVNLTGSYEAKATLDTQRIPLGAIVAAYAPSQAGKLTGETELHATVHGPLKDKKLLEAHALIPLLNLNYSNLVNIAAVSPIHIDYANEVLSVPRTQLRGTDTDLQFQATVPVGNPQAPASLLALGTVDLKLVQLVDPNVATSGQLRLNVDSYGQRSNQNVEGQIQIVNAGFASGDMPLGLEDGNGVLTLTENRLDITTFTGTVGGGQVTASGGVLYRPSLNFNLALAGRGIRLLYPQGVRTQVGTNLALSGNLNSALLNGEVRITQLSLSPDFDLANFMNQFSGDTVPSPSQGFAGNLNLNIGVSATNGITLVSRTLSLDGSANLHVTGTAADPVILGRAVLSGGDLIFQGNRYVLQNGTIDFVNPYQTQPVVDVAVNTTIQQYDIQMRFDGPVEQLHTSYTSVPSLPPSDIINLIAFGKTTEASAANPTPGGSLGAESVVASQVSSQVSSRIAKAAGISQLSIDPELGNNQQNPGAVVALQQRVTGNLFVTFATDVTQTQNTTIKLEYHATPRVSFSGTRDQNGGFGFDTKIHKSW